MKKAAHGVPAPLAAMTEPLAVGVHAVNKSRITERDAAIVLGLAVAWLGAWVGLTERPRNQRRRWNAGWSCRKASWRRWVATRTP